MKLIEPQKIFDKHGRPLEYLRLSVTDRCNLRCFYCMPSEKMQFMPRAELLSYEEMVELVAYFTELGVKKLRITGGEPFVRKDLIGFLSELRKTQAQLDIRITSNGVLLGKYLQELKQLEISKINLSLDTLEPGRFLRITGRDDFDKVFKCLMSLLEAEFEVKLNCVLMKGVNDSDINSFLGLAKEFPIEVRFIEEMPFNGLGAQRGFISQDEIRDLIRAHIGGQEYVRLEDSDSSFSAQPDDFQGRVGIIPAFSRSFCGQCNRIRLSANGQIKTCLFGKDQLNLKDMLRSGWEKDRIMEEIIKAYQFRPKDGIEAEKNSELFSMSRIGG